jgi:histidinol-phosphate aminotransferase
MFRKSSMFDPQTRIRAHIRAMPPYEPILPFEVLSQQLGRAPQDIIKLDANENPYGMLPAIRQALAQMPYGHVYPDPESRALRAALARYHQVPEENLLAGAGADELIDLILRLVITPGDVILNCPPTFGMYAFDGDLNGARVVNVARRPDFSVDVDGLKQAVRKYHPAVLFLASPNNPDGSLIPREVILRLLDLPCLVVVDEAYIEFAEAPSLVTEVPQRTNLIVLRTFSKWAGLAGLRVGFGVFPGALMPHLWKIKQPYNVSVAAATAAITALEHAAELLNTVRQIIAERERLLGLLKTIPWLHPYPSRANFILCRVLERDAAALKRELARHGILVRYFDKPGLQDCIRISVGKPEHTDALLQCLRSL